MMSMLLTYGFAKVVEQPLDTVLKESDVVVTGKVTKVMEFPDASNQEAIKIAEFEIDTFLKGKMSLKRLYFWASPTWSCDISDAKDGERLLLILKKSDKRYLEFSPLYYIAQAGGGRMQIEQHAIKLNSYLEYPQNIESISTRNDAGRYVDYEVMMTHLKQQLSLPK